MDILSLVFTASSFAYIGFILGTEYARAKAPTRTEAPEPPKHNIYCVDCDSNDCHHINDIIA